MDHLDRQMQQWSTRLRDDLKIGPPESNQLATTITKEVAAIPPEVKQRVKDASQIPLPIRIEELVAFQGWMDLIQANEPQPVVVRAQVVYQELHLLCLSQGVVLHRFEKGVTGGINGQEVLQVSHGKSRACIPKCGGTRELAVLA